MKVRVAAPVSLKPIKSNQNARLWMYLRSDNGNNSRNKQKCGLNRDNKCIVIAQNKSI